jgi:hypothetical protein
MNPELLRRTIERAVRAHMREIAPGLENSAVVNIAIEGIIREHDRIDAMVAAIDITAPSGTRRSVSYPPAERPEELELSFPGFHGNAPNWAAEYQGTFSSASAQETHMAPVVDRVDALRLAYEAHIGVDWGTGPDRTAWTMLRLRATEEASVRGETVIVDPPYGLAQPDQDPWPTLDARTAGGIGRGELFVAYAPSRVRGVANYSTLRNLIDLNRFRPVGVPVPSLPPRHPFIQAVLRAKTYQSPAPRCPPLEEPKYGRLSVWDRLRRDPYSARSGVPGA